MSVALEVIEESFANLSGKHEGNISGPYWYNRAARVIIRLVQNLPRAIAVLLVAVSSTGAAQGEPKRPASVPLTIVGFDYSYSTFGGTIDPWHQSALSVETRGSKGTFIGRVNLARRFATV